MAKVFNLYLDESGDFSEPRSNISSPNQQRFANQLAGILVPQLELRQINDEAEKILRNCYDAANYCNFPQEVHGTELTRGEGYDRLISSLVEQIQVKQWQPVRLVNKERVNYGNAAANYLNMLAELGLRIYQSESKKTNERIIINFYCALIFINGEYRIEPHEYSAALRTYFAFAAVRMGLDSSRWIIGNCETPSARYNRILQVCDLLSNASHRSYVRCGEETKAKLKIAFGDYDLTLVKQPILTKLELLSEQGCLGAAIQAIIEHTVKQQSTRDEQQKIDRLASIVARLANSSIKERDLHLRTLANWLEQIIDRQRSLELGKQIIDWLRRELIQPLQQSVESAALSWFIYDLHYWHLKVSNHQGDLNSARQEVTQMQELIPDLAQHWEHISLLMRGLVSQAVHHTDCWEYYEVAKSMLGVFKYYHEISALFEDALPDIFPHNVYSQVEAKALGTWLQSEIHAAAFLPQRIPVARTISDVCIHKFAYAEDKHRQYQYRAQLETTAGNFSLARNYLAQSLSLTDSTHLDIADRITTLNGSSQGFALLHWLRLGVASFMSANDADNAEWQAFKQALTRSRLLYNDWCLGQKFEPDAASPDSIVKYPTLGILRQVAVINTILSGHRNNSALGRLRRLNPIAEANIVFGAIQIATYAEVAALQWSGRTQRTRRLLDSTRSNPGCLQLINTIAAKSATNFPRFWVLTQRWSKSVRAITNGEISCDRQIKTRLLAIGSSVNY